ncbi:class I SAM-dependent methyltransferase [Arthrobacter sp. UYP6]|uniref:class I SAM-dependent methyltransferase n=1 Tax=Arthrobacter sp. UYP6 TaxID=1756378 RepID=UPI003398D229
MEFSDKTLKGVLAWYSLIHIPPDEVPQALNEFARVLVPGGRLLIGFFDGSPRTPFPHAVTTAYYWCIGEMAHLLGNSGFDVLAVETRQDAGKRAHAAITATVRSRIVLRCGASPVARTATRASRPHSRH